jgi:septal ring factor EnvC (AmiA/AmiB activator)
MGTVCFKEGCSKRILKLEQKFASTEQFIKEIETNIELINSEKASLKERLNQQEATSLKLVDENKLLKEKIVSLEKSVNDLENQKIENDIGIK